jgi:hypothetical protein
VDLDAEARGIPWDKLSGRIVYSRWEVEGSDPRAFLFLIEVSARKVKLVRDVPTVGRAPSYEPTGWVREIVFEPGGAAVTYTVLNDATILWELRSRSLDSGLEKVLFPDRTAHHNFPSWSPDGRLAYYANGIDGRNLFVDGRFVLSGLNPSRIAWDGPSKFFVSLPDDSSAGGLYLADPQAQTVTATVTGGNIFDDPAFDPGSRELAYLRRSGDADGEELWIANGDGTGSRRATHGSSDFSPQWSADGRSVLFVRFNAGLFLYDIATGLPTQVTHTRADAVAWAP